MQWTIRGPPIIPLYPGDYGYDPRMHKDHVKASQIRVQCTKWLRDAEFDFVSEVLFLPNIYTLGNVFLIRVESS